MFHNNVNANSTDVSKVTNILTTLMILEETCREVSNELLDSMQGIKTSMKVANDSDDRTKTVVADIIKRRIADMIMDKGKRINEALVASFIAAKS